MSVPYVVLTGIFLLPVGSKYLVVSWAPLLVGDTAEKLYYFNLHQVVQSLILHNYIQHIRWCTQQTVCSTHTHTGTVTELFTYEVLLYSSLYTCLSTVLSI